MRPCLLLSSASRHSTRIIISGRQSQSYNQENNLISHNRSYQLQQSSSHFTSCHLLSQDVTRTRSPAQVDPYRYLHAAIGCHTFKISSHRPRKRARTSRSSNTSQLSSCSSGMDPNLRDSEDKSSVAGPQTRLSSVKTRATGSNGFASELLGSKSSSSSLIVDNAAMSQQDGANMRYMEISVMTLNILAQRYIECHRALYRNCVDQMHTEWNFRKNLLKQTFTDYLADVVCLQEVEAAHYADTIEPHFKSIGYNGILSIKSEDVTEGCAMFYNPRRLKLKSVYQLHMYRPDLSPRLNRNNVAILGTFEGTEPSQVGTTRFHVATTHLLFNPNRGEVKLAQLRHLLSQLEYISRQDSQKSNSQLNGSLINNNNHSNNRIEHDASPTRTSSAHLPVILCGDFNLIPESPLAYFIQSGSINMFDMKAGDLSGQSESRGHGHIIHQSDLFFRSLDRYGRRSEEPPSDWESGGNATAGSGPASAMNGLTIGSVPSGKDEYIVRQPLPMRSVYRSHTKNGENFVTTHHTMASCMVDYIFYHPCAERLQLVKRKQLLTERQMREQGCLPNAVYGSDHLPLWAKFRLAH